MAVRIRLTRMGRKNRPYYRIGAFDARTRRDGRAIEYLGTYDPLIKGEELKFRLDEDRIRYWLSVGAQPSGTIVSFLKKAGIDRSGAAREEGSPTPRES